jgi:hypothetical protein
MDRLYRWLEGRLPRCLVKWATMRLIVHDTSREYETTVVPDLSAMEAVRRWDKV